MDDLSPRQIELFKSDHFWIHQKSAIRLARYSRQKYKLGGIACYDSAMTWLYWQNGYLKRVLFVWTSSTAKAFQFYIKNLMHEKSCQLQKRFRIKATYGTSDMKSTNCCNILQSSSFAKRTQMLTVAITDQRDVYYFGVNNILQHEVFGTPRARYLFEQFDQIPY